MFTWLRIVPISWFVKVMVFGLRRLDSVEIQRDVGNVVKTLLWARLKTDDLKVQFRQPARIDESEESTHGKNQV